MARTIDPRRRAFRAYDLEVARKRETRRQPFAHQQRALTKLRHWYENDPGRSRAGSRRPTGCGAIHLFSGNDPTWLEKQLVDIRTAIRERRDLAGYSVVPQTLKAVGIV